MMHDMTTRAGRLANWASGLWLGLRDYFGVARPAARANR
jgi:hypothetical protein